MAYYVYPSLHATYWHDRISTTARRLCQEMASRLSHAMKAVLGSPEKMQDPETRRTLTHPTNLATDVYALEKEKKVIRTAPPSAVVSTGSQGFCIDLYLAWFTGDIHATGKLLHTFCTCAENAGQMEPKTHGQTTHSHGGHHQIAIRLSLTLQLCSSCIVVTYLGVVTQISQTHA
ncbi:hypothetical protein BC628DRAFT_1494621 [Trametes gibbosa]|nr:hypothetical protein BC628DRAFT_1494621 [Trametes gibbosa]